MPYAQKNFLQPQGIPPTKYRIDQVGCLLTAFCNLMERFGKGLDPANLNAIFRDHKIYIDVDDGVKDDLSWISITLADGEVVATRINNDAKGSWPTSNNAIVGFKYQKNGVWCTHFSLVADAAKHLILDSYDGAVRAPGYYGNPVKWAEYVRNVPTPLPVTVPVNKPANKYEKITPTTYVTNKQPTNIWDLNATTWASFKPVEVQPQGSTFTAVGVYHHPLGADYYMNELWFGNADTTGQPAANVGINHADLSAAPTINKAPATIAPVEQATSEVEKVEVKVIPPNPDLWKKSFDKAQAGHYTFIKDTVVHNLEDTEYAQEVKKGTGVKVIGTVTYKDGKTYYRLVRDNTWLVADFDTLDDDLPVDLDMAQELRDLAHNLSLRQRMIKWLASFSVWATNRKNKSKG